MDLHADRDDQHDDRFLLEETRDFWADDRTRPLARLGARRRPAGAPPPPPSRPARPAEPLLARDDDEFWIDDEFVTPATPTARAVRSVRNAATDIAANARQRVAQLLSRRAPAPRATAHDRHGRHGRPTAAQVHARRRLVLLAVLFVLLVPVALVLRGRDADGAAPGTIGITLAVGTAPGTPADATVSTVEHVPPRAKSSSTDESTSTPNTRLLPSLDDPATTAGAAPKRTEAAAPAAAPAAPATTTALVCTKRYTIVGGDSWSLIASKVKITMRELLAANNATTGTLLLPGRTVCLPANATLPSPTTTTVKAPSTTVAAPPASRPSYSSAQVQQIIRDVWPDELEAKALTIAQRESGFNTYDSNWCCYGAFQINWNAHKGWMAAFGVTSASQLYDPRVNARMALEIYRRSNGWGPWGG